METFFEHVPEIIAQAAKTPLGIIALVILTLSVVAFLLFRRSNLKIRVGVFAAIGIGFALLVAQMLKIESVNRNQSSDGIPQLEARVIAIDGAPRVGWQVLFGGENSSDAILAWRAAYFDAKIVIDAGLTKGVRADDYFAVSSDELDVRDKKGRTLGLLRNDIALIRVVQIQPELSICILAIWHWRSHLERSIEKIAAIDDKEVISEEKAFALVSPIVQGQRAFLLRRDEGDAWNEIIEAVGRAAEVTGDAQDVLYRDVLVRMDRFLGRYPSAYFAPYVLFAKGDLQERLGERGGAAAAFDLYVSRFPFNPSASGARERSERLRGASGHRAVDVR